MACGTKCIQYLMFFFNFLFLLAGGALVGISVWILVDQASFAQLVGNIPYTLVAVYITLGVGVALIVISFFGCCGAIKKNRCMLGTFFALLLLVFLAEIAGAILVFVFNGQIKESVDLSMNEYNATTDNEITQAWDSVQEIVQCCGLTGYTDWANKTWTDADDLLYPASCCSSTGTAPACQQTGAAATDFFADGCEQRFNTLVYIIGGVGAGILLLELLGMIFTCVLMRSAKDDYYS